ncbi:MAG: acyltransferase [Daejeonella sp.]
MVKLLPNLNILRLLLALIVIIYHIPPLCKNLGLPYYNALPFFNKGDEAVKFFFTLSGFLIIKLLYVEKEESGTIKLGRFYLKRILRIFPLYYLITFAGILLYHFILPLLKIPFEIKYDLTDLLVYYTFFIPNVFNSIYDPGAILLTLWSIGIEEQFYLIIPILLFFIKPQKITFFLIILLIAYLGVFFNSASMQFFDFLYFYFLFGGIMAINYYRFKFLNNNLVKLLIFMLFIIQFSTNLLDYYGKLISELSTMIISGLFITMIAHYPPYIIKNKLLNYCGQISYGIYMYHMIIITGVLFFYIKFLPIRSLNPIFVIVSINVVVIIFTLIFAHFSGKYYEAWFIKKKNRLH